MSGKDKLISVEHLKWNVGGIRCGTLTVDYLNWILDHEEPAVDAMPVRHGKWIHIEGTLKCTNCGTEFYDDIMEYCGDDVPKFCPDCGADMRGE